MPRLAGCLIGFHSRLVVNFTDSKCGKGKSIEAFEFAESMHFGLFGFKTYFVVEGLNFVVVETLAET
ncbi:hypothetical protein NL53_20435 [Vibrio variabilis]|uniref:Uncharacterized protein n=1 Tax=Vibrio variabilis TaxID=990271 RepID=A0ABR4Y6Q8_9VIBR|nr:hypothetical protein NL53_20435 [Vibrio variabilis]